MAATPAFWPGESQGQRSLVGYSPWGHKESDTTEALSTHACTQCVCWHVHVSCSEALRILSEQGTTVQRPLEDGGHGAGQWGQLLGLGSLSAG